MHSDFSLKTVSSMNYILIINFSLRVGGWDTCSTVLLYQRRPSLVQRTDTGWGRQSRSCFVARPNSQAGTWTGKVNQLTTRHIGHMDMTVEDYYNSDHDMT